MTDTNTGRVRLTPQAHHRLRTELAALLMPAPTPGTGEPVGQDLPDDGVAEPGMVLTVRYDDTGDTETFLLGLRDVERGDLSNTATWRPTLPGPLWARP